MSDKPGEPPVSVHTLHSEGEYRGGFKLAYYDLKDVRPLVAPMPKHAQAALLQMARLFKGSADQAAAEIAKVRAFLADWAK